MQLLGVIVMALKAACKLGVGSRRSFRRVWMMATKAFTVLGYGIMYFRVLPDGFTVQPHVSLMAVTSAN